MIMTVTQLRTYITTAESDQALEARLQGLESLIRNYTHNNFQKRGVQTIADISGGALVMDYDLIQTGDTIEISQSKYNNGVYTYPVSGLIDEENVTVTKVVYPQDVILGVVNLIKWDIVNRDKVGIASETISRHSVTFFNMDGDNSSMGFPKSLTGFLEPYRKARF